MRGSRNTTERASSSGLRRARPALLLALCLFAAVACTDSRLESHAATAISPNLDGRASSTTVPTDPATGATQPETGIAAEDEGDSAGDGGGEGGGNAAGLCDGLEVRQAGTVANPELFEASGIVASSQHPDVYWAHNDSGSRPALFAIGGEGEDLGSFPVTGIAGVDIEDMALVDGSVYLADIGDNNEVRSSVFVYRFDEPDPTFADEIGPVTTIELVYPDGAHDAEGFFVDPISRELVIVDKSFRIGGGDTFLSPAAGRIFSAPMPDGSTPAGKPIALRQVGTVALDVLASQALATGPDGALFTAVGLGGLATAASIRNDGGAIAVRTYATVWLFERAPEQSVAEALAGIPCEAPSLVEDQGEAIGFLADAGSDPGQGSGFVTVSEGANPGLNVTEPQPR